MPAIVTHTLDDIRHGRETWRTVTFCSAVAFAVAFAVSFV
jgi:hypothetical protein